MKNINLRFCDNYFEYNIELKYHVRFVSWLFHPLALWKMKIKAWNFFKIGEDVKGLSFVWCIPASAGQGWGKGVEGLLTEEEGWIMKEDGWTGGAGDWERWWMWWYTYFKDFNCFRLRPEAVEKYKKWPINVLKWNLLISVGGAWVWIWNCIPA